MSDMDISALDHCTTRQLKELVGLAFPEANATRNWLLEIGDMEQLERLLTVMSDIAGQPGKELLKAVCASSTPLETLVAVKSTAKRLVTAAMAPELNAAATLLYHLSIAAALAQYGRNISSVDAAGRLPLYRELAAELADEGLAEIFEKAAGALDRPP